MSSSKSSTDPGVSGARGEIVLARLGRPKGLKGEIWLHLNTDRPEAVLGPGPHRLSDGTIVEVERLTNQNGRWLWTLAGFTREALAALVNRDVVAAPTELPAREDGVFSEIEIVGLKVVDTLGRARGRIVRIERRYEIDTWIVEDDAGREGEIPAVSEFVRAVDVKSGIVTVEPNSILTQEES